MAFDELIISAIAKHFPDMFKDFSNLDKMREALDEVTLTDIIESVVEDSDIQEISGILTEVGVNKGVEVKTIIR